MVDYFKLRGEVNYLLDSYCISDDKNYNYKIVKYKVYNCSRSEFLELTHTIDEPNRIRINGNLRKWWYGKKSAINDLSKTSLKKALKQLSKRIGVPYIILINMELFYIELGGNIKLERKYDLFIPSVFGFPRLERQRYNNKSVTFIGSKYSIILYDKLHELKDRGIISKKVADKLIARFFILRFEIKVKAKSGFKHKEKVRSFSSILKNYDFLVDYWLDSFYQLDFIDLFSDVVEIKRNEMSGKRMFEFLAFKAIRELRMDHIDFLCEKFIKSHKSKFKENVRRVYSENLDGKRWNYYTHISSSVSLKAGKLKC